MQTREQEQQHTQKCINNIQQQQRTQKCKNNLQQQQQHTEV